MDLSKYTKESVETFKAALENAKAVMADKDLSDKDQAKVDQAEKDLQTAIDGLKLADGDGNNGGDDNNNGNTGDSGNNNGNGNTGAGGSNTGKDAPKTGDSANMAVWFMLMAAATAAGISVRRRKNS